MAINASTSNTPRTYFGISNRLLRGYGPLAVLAVMLVMMSILVPSRVAKNGALNAGGGSSGSNYTGDTVPDASTDTTLAGDPTVTTAGGNSQSTVTKKGSGPVSAAAGAKITQCAGRQVPGDPYSPPCVSFSGSNGGATWKGVTDKEVQVSFRVLNEKGFQQTLAELAGATLSDSPDDIKRTVDALSEYFNSHYQFYGRKLAFKYYNGVGSNTAELLGKGDDKAKTDALTVKDMKVFADMSATSAPYADHLARDAQTLGFGDPYLSQKWHDDHRPYIWSIATDGTEVADFAAEYAVKRLCHKNATWAGGTDSNGKSLNGQPRKFATLVPENDWYQVSVEHARQYFSDHGCDPGNVNVKYQLDLSTMSNQADNIIAKLKSEGATTVVCGCDPIMPVFLSGVAHRQNYYPEFIIVGTALTDTDIVGQLWDQDFASHAFGVSSLTDPLPATQSLGYAAFKKVRPNEEPAFSVDLIYYQMAQMAIGIQMAGPNLNPTTFEQGMFAYPPSLGPAGLWSFGPHDYTAADDVREIYWDRNATSKYNQKQGAFVESEPGKRYRRGEITPADPKVFVNQ